MAKLSADEAQVNARILYWGIEGAGKRTSLSVVQNKLRSDHRGELREIPTRLDPSVTYTVLPISLGEVGGMKTQIELLAVPGDPAQGPTRKQLLDEVDGVVFVVDTSGDRIEQNAAMLDELRKGLADYARRLEDLPLVVQYNKRDRTDDYRIDELHRRLDLGSTTVFETIATEGTGVLQALSTISKKVIRALRGDPAEPTPTSTPAPPPAPPEPVAAPAPPVAAPAIDAEALAPAEGLEPGPALEVSPEDFEEAILAEGEEAEELDDQVAAAQSILEQPWHHEGERLDAPLGARIGQGLSIVSVGDATRVDDRSVRIPLVMGDGDGETSTLVLTIQLDPLLDEPH